MAEVISLKTTMQRRMNFRHELLDYVDAYKIEMEALKPIISSYLKTKSKEDRDKIVLGTLWMAKDVVCRFRAHFPETRIMTDELASEAILAVHNFLDIMEDDNWFSNRLQAFIHNSVRNYINDNRSTFSGSRETNFRRIKLGQEPEYNFAVEYNDELVGEEHDGFHFVDMLADLKSFLDAYRKGEIPITPEMVDFVDSIERLLHIDYEEMRDLVLGHLQKDYHLSEEELTDQQQKLLSDMLKIGVLL